MHEQNEVPPGFTKTPRVPATSTPAAARAECERLLADVANRFTYHPPKPDQLPRYEELRDRGRSLAEHIVRLTPPSREQALALTHLEEAIFFANAAIARHE